ncbi:MAG TPA: DUF488 domain-containing protein [Streptosporangiaceae bacterium]
MTFGHGTAPAETITALLREAGVVSVVDIRIAPGSRRNPQVARAALEEWLPAAGVAYRWEKRLGGFRKAAADSPDAVWREPAFRGYAGYMRQDGFATAIDGVLDEVAGLDAGLDTGRRVAVMCSESVWWRCHRRLVADFVLLARRLPVRHLMHDGRLMEHQPSEGVRVRDDGSLVYDGGQGTLL